MYLRLTLYCVGIIYSGLFLIEKNFTNIIGGIERDSKGNIIGAKAILHGQFGKMNTTRALVDVHSITDALGVYVSEFNHVFSSLWNKMYSNFSDMQGDKCTLGLHFVDIKSRVASRQFMGRLKNHLFFNWKSN